MSPKIYITFQIFNKLCLQSPKGYGKETDIKKTPDSSIIKSGFQVGKFVSREAM
jgi:hypothetical protein